MKALTVEDIGTWERNGFLKVENFVDAEELANIRRIMEGLVEQDPPDENTIVDIDPVLADRTDIPRTEKFRALLHAAHASPELLETYTLRPKTLDVVEDLIGPDIVYYTDQTFLKPPGGSGAPAHQDNVGTMEHGFADHGRERSRQSIRRRLPADPGHTIGSPATRGKNGLGAVSRRREETIHESSVDESAAASRVPASRRTPARGRIRLCRGRGRTVHGAAVYG